MIDRCHMSKKMGKRSTPNVVYPATLELIEAYQVGPQDGVYVYLLTPQNVNLTNFFLVTYGVTYEDGSIEVTWGHGNTPLEALEDAEATWNKVGDHDYENPFSLALRRRAGQEDWRWE